MSVLGAGRALCGWATNGATSVAAAVLAKPINGVKYLLDIPKRSRDSITRPVAERMVAYWCSGARYEKRCLDQAYSLTDQAIHQAVGSMQKTVHLSGMVMSEDFRAIDELTQSMEKTRKIGVIDSLFRGVGSGFKWAGDWMGSSSSSMDRYGKSMGESPSRMSRWTGKALSLGSYLPWGASYAPAAIGHVLGKTRKAPEQSRAVLDFRKRIAENVFLPLILKGNEIGKTYAAQGCLNFGVNAGYLYASGLLNANSWAEMASDTISTSRKCVFALQALVGGWIWAPPAKSTLDVANACYTRKHQTQKLKTELLKANPNLETTCSAIPGGIDFLLGYFLKSHSFLLSHLTHSPEKEIQAFCDWSEVLGMAARIGEV